jgi:hypothetical protein
MATTATPTLVKWSDASGGVFKGIFTLVFDTTDGNGEMTCDLTTWFYDIYGIKELGSAATTGYVCQWEKPAFGTAITSTNVKIGIYEAGADAAALDAVASTDVSAVITVYTIEVTGRQAV